MKKQYWALSILVSAASISLSSCQSGYSFSELWSNDADISTENQNKTNNLYYPEPSTSSQQANTSLKTATKPTYKVAVPASYYLATGVPQSHQNADKNWIDQQNASGYTIELDNNERASVVAKTLQEAPKNERMAQIQYDKNGKPMYLGVYGSFLNKEAAKAALEKLPPEMREKAKIKSWNNVQEKAATTLNPTEPSVPSVEPPVVSGDDTQVTQ